MTSFDDFMGKKVHIILSKSECDAIFDGANTSGIFVTGITEKFNAFISFSIIVSIVVVGELKE